MEKKAYSAKEIEKIILDNENLSEQVKRLVKTEYALYNTQSELDNQIVIYKELYETGKKTISSLKTGTIFSEMGNFIIDRLNFGGYLLFERKAASFVANHCGGCCAQRTRAERTCDARWLETTIEKIHAVKEDFVITEHDGGDSFLAAARSFFGFCEFVVHSFCIDKKKRPSYLLVVGNPQNKEFFNPIAPNTIAMIGLGNLASLIENALNNVIHYQQLIEERKTLEIKVRERTEDLGRALKDLKKLNAKLHYLSYKDELTGLYNRRGFFTVGEKYFNMAKRKNTEMLVVFCDLNRFKDINDSYGHKEGDEALKQTAMILKTAFRNYDIVSRFGGDEFVLLLDNTTASDFQSLKKRLDTALAAYNDSSGKKYRISISYGFSSFKYDRNPALTFDDLLDEADKMLYAEKRKKPEFAKRPRHSKRPVKMPTP